MPPELGRQFDLNRLDLSGNQLTGPLPPELGQLTYLQQLDLSDNQLTGPVPQALGHFPHPPYLESLDLDLDLSGNALTGCLPAAWQDRFSVTTRASGEPQNLPYCPD